MSKNDELDRRRAAAFAWRFTRPGEVVDLPEEEPADAQETAVDQGQETAVGTQDPAPSPAASTRDRREPPDVCAALTDAIELVRRNAEVELFGVLTPLLRRAGDVAIEIFHMEGYPWQSERLRERASFCRHGRGEKRWGPAPAAGPHYGNRKRLEVVLELARTQALSSLTSLMLAIAGGHCAPVARAQAAAVRVARLLDDGPGHIASCVPEDALSDDHARRVLVPMLRRALRSRHFLRRCRALELLDRYFPDEILPADVCFLLHDMVLHALPEYREDAELAQAESSYLTSLERAIVRLRPMDALEPLVRMSRGLGARRRTEPYFRDEAWALHMLAILAPDAAAIQIDRQLAQSPWPWREMALEAVRRLPDEQARPRLLAAAADVVPAVAQRAQAVWRDRYDYWCPFDPLSNVELGLLEGAPSERMYERLITLRTDSIDARAAMIGELLDEAPDPEALVLLLFTALDDHVWAHRMGPGEAGSRTSFCRILVERFGPLAVEGLLALADRYRGEGWYWLETLAELVMGGVVPEAAHLRLRVMVATRFWRGADGLPLEAALQILAYIGPPSDLAESLLTTACDEFHSKATRAAAVRALAHLSGPDGRLLDSSVLFDMNSACAASDLPRFARIAAVGFARALPAAFELTERVLADFGPARPEDARVIAGLAECIEGLVSAGRMSEASLREALDRPGTYLYAAAARHALGRELPESEVQALLAVCAHGDPVCSAEAARTLLSGGAISPRDPELFVVAAQALPAQRAELVHEMHAQGATWSHLWPLLESLLSSTDSAVHAVLRRMASRFTSEGLPEKLRPLLSRVVDPGLRRYIESILTWTSSARDRYWKDSASRWP